MDAELEKFKREIDLVEFAGSYGFAVDERASCRTCVVMRHQGDKIVVATSPDDHHGIFFDVHGDCRGGSVIDFVMWQRGVNLGFARVELRKWLNIPHPSFPTALRTVPKPEPMSRDRAGLFARWQGLRPYRAGYLEGRGLSAATIGTFTEQLRTDERGNVCFRHDDENGLSGWELKNKGSWQGFAGGGKKALFCCRVGEGNTPVLVIAESAIDVMSYYQLNTADGLYISFAGGLSPEQKEQLRGTLTRYPQAVVVIATDNDLPTEQHPEPEGEKYADFIRSIRPDAVRACPPEPFKDWNDKLNNRPRPVKKGGSYVEQIAGASGAGKSPEFSM